MNAVMACLLLLTLCSPPRITEANATATPADTRLEDVITEWDWAHEVRLGKVNGIESQTLTFCAGGRVRERIGDDTGIHDSYGTWALEHTPDGYVLTLSGEQLHYRGRYPTTY